MSDAAPPPEGLVPDEVIPHQHLPPLRYRDMPAAIPWTRMVGPSLILAGLALGSGEYVFWPHIVYKSGFVFFWACLLGVVTQYFLNMEIERWTLVTGETAITGFCRLSRQWAWVMLVMNIIPWAWPGWSTGAAQITSWLVFGAEEQTTASGQLQLVSRYVPYLAIASLLLIGVVLTAGPVVYNTVEKIQTVLVASIVLLVIVIACLVVRADAVKAMLVGSVSIGQMPDLEQTGLKYMGLLGALAFAGAGGTLNLGQSNYIRDKGYGMGRYIGRITSPLTGEEEPMPEVGYHFPHTPENLRRWRQWWRAANIEHLFSFLLTCIVCLVLLTLISYSLFYTEEGTLAPGMERFGSGMNFVWGEAQLLQERFVFGRWVRLAFLVVGVAILLTTELGVLDGAARVSTDILKTNYLRHSDSWTASRLYYCFLWGEIALGTTVLLLGLEEPLFLLNLAASLNGGVMFIYSLLLLYLSSKILPRGLSISPLRFVVLVWSCAFFGYFTFQALADNLPPLWHRLAG